jgi:hypothetical protein
VGLSWVQDWERLARTAFLPFRLLLLILNHIIVFDQRRPVEDNDLIAHSADL